MLNMKRRIPPLVALLLTFIIGITCVLLFRAVISWHKLQTQRSQEAILRKDLFQLRLMIDQYAAGKGEFLHSLDDLVRTEYLREIPTDPMTGISNWQVVMTDCPGDSNMSHCYIVVDVRSSSKAISSEGNPYNEW
jgi:general secretion pathway protein G